MRKGLVIFGQNLKILAVVIAENNRFVYEGMGTIDDPGRLVCPILSLLPFGLPYKVPA